jgi:O-antigen ligase
MGFLQNFNHLFQAPPRHQWLYISTLFFLISFFLVPNELIISLFFYLGMMPATLLILSKENSLSVFYNKHPFASLGISALIGYAFIHTIITWIWHDQPFRPAKHAIFTLIFIVASALNFRDKDQSRLIFKCLIIAGLLSSGIALINSWETAMAGKRLQGFAQLQHSILGAIIYGMTMIMSLSTLPLKNRILSDYKWPLMASFTFPSFFLMLSKGPILSLGIVAGLFTVLWTSKRLLCLYFVIVAVLIGVTINSFYAFLPEIHDTLMIIPFYENLYDRGASLRPKVWSISFEKILKRPFLGHGQSRLTNYFHHPHNLYLSASFRYGVLILIPLLFTQFHIFKLAASFSSATGKTIFLIAIYSAINVLTDFDDIVSSPDIWWLIFWLPIGAVIGHAMTSGDDSHA